MWNVHRRTIDSKARTSNNIEGWHHGIKYSVWNSSKYNHILKIIDVIKLEQHQTEHLLTRMDTGAAIERRKKAYIELDNRITAILEDYSVQKPNDFFFKYDPDYQLLKRLIIKLKD